MMQKNLLLILIIFPSHLLASSFNVEVHNGFVRVKSPEKEVDPVSVVVKNTTDIKAFAEIRSTKKALKKFAVEGGKTAIFQIKLPKDKKLYYFPISPPSQSVELIFNQRPYAVPEQK